MKDVKGKTAFITGGAAGIGLALAKVFARAGMKVVIADLRQDHLDEAMAELGKAKAQAHAIRLDVSDRKAFAAAADEAQRVFGNVHVVCNNAGVNIIRPIDEATFEDVDWLINVNLMGVFNGVLTFVPRIKAHGEGGHIVNTSSIAGIITGPGTGIYSATKFGIRGLSDSLRFDLAPHRIGVSVLCPGTVSTRLYESEENRPERWMGRVDETVKKQRAGTGELFRRVLPLGMDPMMVAERTLTCIQENRFYIMSHREVDQDIREGCEEMMAALPDVPLDPERVKLEAGRRQKKYDLLKLLKDL
jgi:NAD(P)-dependent dehydrogenase (short-subunit alcohol dehydrogenase family)